MASVASRDRAAQIRLTHARNYLSEIGVSEEDIARSLSLSGDDIVYASGSITDGLGDGASDLDLFVITNDASFRARAKDFDKERETQQRSRDFGISYISVGGREFDVEFHKFSKFERMQGDLRRLDPRDRDDLWRNFRYIGDFERTEFVEMLHRFRIGAGLANRARYDALRGAFDDRRFLAWNAHFHLIECEDYVKGVSRSLRQSDPENAYLKLMRLYDSLADAVLFLNGDSLDRWKWRLPKLRRSAPEILDTYRRVQLGIGTEGDLVAFVSKHLHDGEAMREALMHRLLEFA